MVNVMVEIVVKISKGVDAFYLWKPELNIKPRN